MIFQRFLSIGLIFLVLLSSTDGMKESAVADKNDDGQTELSFSEFSADLSHDFRESHKTTLSQEESNDSFIAAKPSGRDNEAISTLQYEYYWQTHHSRKTSKRLFISFGALII